MGLQVKSWGQKDLKLKPKKTGKRKLRLKAPLVLSLIPPHEKRIRNLMRIKFITLTLLLLSPSHSYAQLMNQLSDSKDDSPIIIEADESVVCDETAQKCVATGLASAQKGSSTVYGDILTVYF